MTGGRELITVGTKLHWPVAMRTPRGSPPAQTSRRLKLTTIGAIRRKTLPVLAGSNEPSPQKFFFLWWALPVNGKDTYNLKFGNLDDRRKHFPLKN